MAETCRGAVKVSDSTIDKIIKNYGRRKEFLICILQDIQTKYGFLPRDALEKAAIKLDMPLMQIYSVATFFKAFSLEPRGKHLINVCLGTACHVRGAERVIDKIKRDLEIEAGETTQDREFTLETVNCLGACALGPIMVLDGKYHGQMTTTKVDSILKKI